MNPQTLRADLIETAARAHGSQPITSQRLAEWLECSGAAAGLARRHGLNRQGLQDAVDRLSWRRLVTAAEKARAASAIPALWR